MFIEKIEFMANGVKQYKIEINGIDVAIKDVDLLIKQLDQLDAKIKEMSSKTVKVSTGSGTSGLKSPDEELYKKIESIQNRIDQASSEEYEILLKKKAELKEIEKIQKSNFAQTQAEAKEYANTLNGQRQRLTDMKAALANMEIGSDGFNKQIADINTLTDKIKEIEFSFQQYGRNVGNYANGVSEGISKLKVDIAGTVKEFDNAKQALMEVRKEVQTLSAKQDLGIITDEESERLKSLIPTFKQLQSSIQDAGKPMDALMDSMQGMVAIASTAQGFGALFGLDGSKIQESIQKLMALQNIMRGIETIGKQMDTGEGIGGWFARGSEEIDRTIAKLTGAKLGMNGLEGSTVKTTKALRGFSAALKAISGVAAIYAIQAAMNQLSSLVNSVKSNWSKMFGESADEAQQLETALTNLNAQTERQLEMIDANVRSGKISDAEAYTQRLVAITNELRTQNALLEENIKKQKEFNTGKMIKEFGKTLLDGGGAMGFVMNNLDKLTDGFINLFKETDEGLIPMEQCRAKLQEVGNDVAVVDKNIAKYAENYVRYYMSLFDGIDASTEEGKKKIKELIDAMNSDEILQTILMNPEKFLMHASEGFTLLTKNFYDKVNLFNKTINKEEERIYKNSLKKTKSTTKKAEVDIAKARIDAMKEGLTKTLAQLQHERDKRIAEAKKTGKAVEEQIYLINQQYDSKILDAKAKYYADRIKMEKDFTDYMKEQQEQLAEQEIENSRKANEREKQTAIDKLMPGLGEGSRRSTLSRMTVDYTSNLKIDKEIIQSWDRLLYQINDTKNAIKALEEGEVQLFNGKNLEEHKKQLEDLEKDYAKLIEKTPELAGYDEGEIQATLEDQYITRTNLRMYYYQKLLEISQDAADKEYKIEETRIEKEIGLDKQLAEERKRHIEVYGKLTPDNMTEDGANGTPDDLDAWLNSLNEAVQQGEITWEDYIQTTGATALQGYLQAKTEYENFLIQYNAMSAEEQEANKGLLQQYQNERLIQYQKYYTKLEQEQELHKNKERVIYKQSEEATAEATRNHQQQIQNANADFFANIEQETEIAVSAIRNKIDKAESKNAWGIINYDKTKDALKDIQATTIRTLEDINRQKSALFEALQKDDINFEQYDAAIGKLDTLQTQTEETAEQIKDKLDNLGVELWKGINEWIQNVGQAAVQILSSLSEAQDNEYQAMIDKQEEYIKKYEELLDEQREKTQQYADAVNEIEGELATARGDRREQLIDQLNAQIAAQRASLAEEKRIEKEKDKAEKKKKKLEYEQAVAKKKMDLAQAYINAAMAVSMAAVNKWPIPAIPMMALAAAVGAAQIAAVQSQKIPSYGEGGLLVGRKHSEGGIKVLGGTAEVEGGEYVTNRRTTALNQPVLEYINSNKRKLTLDDFIDFYNGSGKKNIRSITNKFADGGQLPNVDVTTNTANALLNAFESYSNRPVVVSVKEITDTQTHMTEVQTLAGL